MFERRNFEDRAELFARLIQWVRALRCPAAEVPAEIAPPTVAERILKQLALRTLVRRRPEGWVPSPLLVQSIDANPVDAAA